MLIRSEDARDYSDIHELLVSAFSTDQEAMLVRRLRESGRLITSLVAIADGVVAGQIALSPVTIATAGESAIGQVSPRWPSTRGSGAAALPHTWSGPD